MWKSIKNRFRQRNEKECGSEEKGSDLFNALNAVEDASFYVNYEEAFDFILKEPVKNIAITGPYGSGKSSLILTFQKKNSKHECLNLSLATFTDGNPKELDEIEKSIFKQMLYGEKANSIPYSRFRGVTTPENAVTKSIYLLLSVVGVLVAANFKTELIDFARESRTQLAIVIVLTFSLFGLLVGLMSWCYRRIFGLSIKKVTSKGELEIGSHSKESVFNEHLDEIIYFFKSTNYAFVIIEDLDRFDKPEIFTNLRELNKLINENEGVRSKRENKPIKFIYALRDDMFCDKERTKFFDFIIPVIPFINSSNSYDKLCDRLEKAKLHSDIDKAFLRDISLHINDFRHLNNTVNEYIVYVKNLNNEKIDKTKLFAMVLYKNFYPDDFEALHDSKGKVFAIIQEKQKKVNETKARLKSEIREINDSIEMAKQSVARNLECLHYMYMGYIYSKVTQPIRQIQIVNRQRRPNEPSSIEDWKEIQSSDNIIAVTTNGNPQNIALSAIESKIHPSQTINEKIEELNRCNKDNTSELRNDLENTQEKLRTVNQNPLKNLLNYEDIAQLCKKHEEENKNRDKKKISYDLLIYLIKKGYIDESYHIFTSYFHEGTMTQKDHDFLLAFQMDQDMTYDSPIDTPKEICERLKNTPFFETARSLNAHLYDYLLENEKTPNHHRWLQQSIENIKRDFKQCEDFLLDYYTTGKQREQLLNFLCNEWGEFGTSAVQSNSANQHMAMILAYISDPARIEEQNKNGDLSNYLEEFSHEVYDRELLFEKYDTLNGLNVKIKDLSQSSQLSGFLDYIIKNNCYKINAANLTFILSEHESISKNGDPTYTNIRNSKIEPFKTYIESNIIEYVESVLLPLEDNSSERKNSVIALLNNENLDAPLKEKIITHYSFEYNLENIPEEMWDFIVDERKVIISWNNVSQYYKYEENQERIIEWLNEEDVYESLSHIKAESNTEVIKFILGCDQISDEAFECLLSSQQWKVSILKGELSHRKWIYLLNRKFTKLTDEVYKKALIDPEVLEALIRNNYEDYSKNKTAYPLSNEIILLLLQSDLPEEHKENLCYDINSVGIETDQELASMASIFLAKESFNTDGIDDLIVEQAILNASSNEDAIRILNKRIPNWTENKVMRVLKSIGGEYAKISSYGAEIPRIKKNEYNSKLASLLIKAHYISSAPPKKGGIKINTKKTPG